MKKRIKINKNIIKESLDEATLPPKGANSGGREPTMKMTPDMKHGEHQVPEDIRKQIADALEASKEDPTQKLPMTDRLKNWFSSLLAPEPKSYTDSEVDAMSAPKKPEFKGIQIF